MNMYILLQAVNRLEGPRGFSLGLVIVLMIGMCVLIEALAQLRRKWRRK